LTLAAGLGAGYVLGARAGREKYEQIAAAARRISDRPAVVPAQETPRAVLDSGSDRSDPAPLDTSVEVAGPPATSRKSRNKRRPKAAATPTPPGGGETPA